MSATTTYPYTFDSISRIGNDNVAIDQRNIQNMNNANYNNSRIINLNNVDKDDDVLFDIKHYSQF